MREPAVVGETKNRITKLSYDVNIGRFRGQGQGCGRQRRLAVQPGASQTCSEEKMSDWFQVDFLTHQSTRFPLLAKNAMNGHPREEQNRFLASRGMAIGMKRLRNSAVMRHQQRDSIWHD